MVGVPACIVRDVGDFETHAVAETSDGLEELALGECTSALRSHDFFYFHGFWSLVMKPIALTRDFWSLVMKYRYPIGDLKSQVMKCRLLVGDLSSLVMK